MNCPKCEAENPPGAVACSSCAAPLPSVCSSCGAVVPAGVELCDQCTTEQIRPDFDPPTLAGGPIPGVEVSGEALEEPALPKVRAAFVGRMEPLQRLKQLFLECREKRELKVVTLVGDPGVGKSRLALEFSRSVRAAVPDARVLAGASMGMGEPLYAPIIAALSERFGIARSELPRDARLKIESAVEEVLPERLRTEVAHLLAHLMNIPAPGSHVVEPLAEVPGQLEVRTFIAARRFFEKDSEHSTLLFHFDGIERAGPESINLMLYLAEGLRNCPVFFLVTARPTLFRRHPQWGQGEFDHQRIDVDPLTSAEAESLFTELMHNRGIPEELVIVARDRLGGSPRSIEELTRYLLEAGVVIPSMPRWTVRPDRLASLHIPRTHEEILRARLGAVPPEERDLLEKAAAIGETFWLDAVVALLRSTAKADGDPDGPSLSEIAEVGERSRTQVSRLLARLCERGLVQACGQSTIGGELEFRFSYPPIWDLTYALIDEALRLKYHRLAAQWLELRPEGRLEEQQELAGRHLQRAGDGLAAGIRYRRAADNARSRYFNDKAINLYTRALACIGDADLPSRIHLWHDLGSVYQLKGDLESALDAFERMLRLGWVVASRSKGAVAFNKMGRVWRQKGNLDLALEYLERGHDLFRVTGDKRGVSTSLDDIAMVKWMLGRYDEALDTGAKALEMRRQLGDKRSIAFSLSNIGNIEKDRGLFDEAEACFREAMELRKEVGDRYGHIVSLSSLGSLSFERGNLEQARDTWEDALAEAERIGAIPLQVVLLNRIGEAARELGKTVDARKRIERAMALAAEAEDQQTYVEVLLNLTLLELKEGNNFRAKQLSRECLDLAQKSQHKDLVGRAQLTQGEVHATTLFDESDPASGGVIAEEYFRKASKVFREIGNGAELARSLKRLGEFQVESGRVEDGLVSLKEAADIFERLGMRVGEEVRHVIAELEA
jgi:tetratricopeptide (TPR) repeat protein/ribosomal protein L40E